MQIAKNILNSKQSYYFQTKLTYINKAYINIAANYNPLYTIRYTK